MSCMHLKGCLGKKKGSSRGKRRSGISNKGTKKSASSLSYAFFMLVARIKGGYTGMTGSPRDNNYILRVSAS